MAVWVLHQSKRGENYWSQREGIKGERNENREILDQPCSLPPQPPTASEHP